MIGYGPEEENFALELTYNYGIDSYKSGNDLQYISLQRDIEDTKAKAEAEGERCDLTFDPYMSFIGNVLLPGTIVAMAVR